MAIEWSADLVVIETNRGGNLGTQLLEAERDKRGLNTGIREVLARDNKESRADPVAALYEQGMVVHVGAELGALEDQMLAWEPLRSRSPDRIDALVWAVWELVGKDNRPAVYEGQRLAGPSIAQSVVVMGGGFQRW